MLSYLRNRLYLAVITGHFAVDVLNSITPVLLAVMAIPLGLTNSQIGITLTLQIFAGSLSQPIFGWAADRFKGRQSILAGLGMIWMIVFFSGAVMASNWPLLLTCLLLGALGSGLFHPIGTASAAAANPERAGSSTAIFFFCGQVGLALGPALGGILLGVSGSGSGALPLGAIAFIPAILLLTAPLPARRTHATRRLASATHNGVAIITAFIVLVAIRSSIQQIYMSFLPKLFSDRGWEPAAYGALSGAFMLTAAVGNIITGDIADRYGMRAATIWPLLLSVPAGLLCLWAPTPVAAFAGAAFAGLLIGGQHSVLVVHAQRMLPTGQGFAAGLILGFTFATGGIGTWLGGIAADYIGLLAVMQVATLLAIPVALLALTLPGRSMAETNPTLAKA